MTILLVGSATGVDEPNALGATLRMRLATLWLGVLIGLILLAIARGRIAKRQRAPAG